MKLRLLERLLVAQILPREGGIVTLRIIDDLRKKLPITQKEIKDFGLKDGLTDVQCAQETEIALTIREEELIVAQLRELERKQKLNIGLKRLWEELVEKPRQEKPVIPGKEGK